jgi:spore germination protein
MTSPRRLAAALGCALVLAAAPAARAAGPMVLAYYAGYPNNYASLTANYASFDAASIDYYDITAKGTVVGNGDPAPTKAINFLQAKKIPAYGCVSNVDGDWSPQVAHSVMTTWLDAAVANLVAFAQANRFAGINIDFEAVDQADRANFSNFTQVLADALHAQGLKLIVSVPAFSAIDFDDPYNYAYDLRALGASADFLQLMTYDEAIPGWDPGPVAGSDWMEDDLDYATSLVPPAKLLNGLPAYGYDWRRNDSGSQLFWVDTPALVAKYGVTPKYDLQSNSETFSYKAKDGSGRHTVWTENARSIALKAGLVGAYGLGGTSVYALGMEDAAYWTAVRSGLGR